MRLRSVGMDMVEASSEEYLRQKWAQKRPGYMAGAGESAVVPARETSNRWQGKSYAAYIPDDVNEKCAVITQENVVGDPGKLNSGWESGTMLNVIRSLLSCE